MSDEENEIDDKKMSATPDVVEGSDDGGDARAPDEDESEETKEVVTVITESVRVAVNNRLKKLKQNNNTSSLPTLIAEIIKKDYPNLELVAGDINEFQTYYLSH